jgi:hypothetical protein
MANYTYFIPTENKDKVLNLEELAVAIQEKCPELIVKYQGNIEVEHKKEGYVVCEIYPEDEPCYLLNDIEGDIKWAQEKGKTEIADSLAQFVEIDGGNLRCISMKNGIDFTRRSNKVYQIIHQLGKCFVFFEGIHPEHTPPNHIHKRPVKSERYESMMWNKLYFLPWHKRLWRVVVFNVLWALGYIPLVIWSWIQKVKGNPQ